MFLHSAAGMHSHEYSPPSQRRSEILPKRSPLARSSFSTPGPAIITPYDNPMPPLLNRRSRALSEYIPRTSEHTVRFKEPDTDTMSEDGRSVANSDGSWTTRGGRRRRKSSRTSTAFHIAHPAPTLTQKQRLLQIRPKLLLQLQLLSPDKRPRPALDVLPSTVVIPRLVKRFPRMFRGKGELGANDVMIVKSEEYDTPYQSTEENDSDEEGFAHRDLIAVICQLPKDEGGSQGKAEIVLGDGTVWLASPLPTGAYEMITVNEKGEKTTVRWVKRAAPRSSDDSTSSDTKFAFSTIDPSSRRHPIMATITQQKLDIPDYYTSVSSLKTALRSSSDEVEDEIGELEAVTERTAHPIDEKMKTLIQVTGIWVSLRQGWSPYFKYNDAMATFSQTKSPRNSMSGRARASSLTPDIMRSTSGATRSSTPEPNALSLTSVSDKLRWCGRGSPVSASSPQDSLTGPRRMTSTGTAFMQRAAGRRIGPIASDSEGESISQQAEHSDSPHVKINGNALSNRVSSPPALGIVASPPPSPTKPHRRVQSVHILSNHISQDASSDTQVRPSEDIRQSPGTAPKRRLTKWKNLVNIFRRRGRTA
ncbi:hypothetical protein CJF32_00002751 [Rutstroemia sp. NJR-2017a WRK4]|nr:hypothetical protein CJF32_00002751 [Rutstroemia sp. NJR-2017a WRK4]